MLRKRSAETSRTRKLEAKTGGRGRREEHFEVRKREVTNDNEEKLISPLVEKK